ncbi:MAG: hypothetical protein ACK4NS_01715 [Saprospiraceae bacterium]
MKKQIVIAALIAAFAACFAAPAQAQETPNFAQFLAQFPKADLPFSLTAEDLTAQLAPGAPRVKRLGWDFYGFLPELKRSAQYSNMPVYPEPVAAFETENYYAVLYNIARGLGKGAKSYSMSIYDKNGAYIGTNFVAGINAETLTTVTINANLEAIVTEYDAVRVIGEGDVRIEYKNRKGSIQLDLTIPGNPDQIEWSAAGALTTENIAASR